MEFFVTEIAAALLSVASFGLMELLEGANAANWTTPGKTLLAFVGLSASLAAEASFFSWVALRTVSFPALEGLETSDLMVPWTAWLTSCDEEGCCPAFVTLLNSEDLTDFNFSFSEELGT